MKKVKLLNDAILGNKPLVEIEDILKSFAETDDINERIGFKMGTVLHSAVFTGRVDVMKLLLANDKIDVYATSDLFPYDTAMHITLDPKSKKPELAAEMIKLLAYHGGREMPDEKLLNFKDDLGHSCLHFAVTRKKIESTRMLLELGADANSTDRHENTPLGLLASEQSIATRVDIIKLLLDHGAKANSYFTKAGLSLVEERGVNIPLTLIANVEEGQILLRHIAVNRGDEWEEVLGRKKIENAPQQNFLQHQNVRKFLTPQMIKFLAAILPREDRELSDVVEVPQSEHLSVHKLQLFRKVLLDHMNSKLVDEERNRKVVDEFMGMLIVEPETVKDFVQFVTPMSSNPSGLLELPNIDLEQFVLGVRGAHLSHLKVIKEFIAQDDFRELLSQVMTPERPSANALFNQAATNFLGRDSINRYKL